MKAIFFVHTHITFYVSKAIIKSLNLRSQDYLFIKSRNYNNILEDVNAVDLSEINEKLKCLPYCSFKSRIELIKEVDEHVESASDGDTFRLFVPHIGDPLMQALARHSKCHEVNFIEEGANCYSKEFFRQPGFSIKQMIKSILNFVDVHRKSRYGLYKQFEFEKELKGRLGRYYTISHKGFQYADTQNVVVLKLIPEELDYTLESDAIIVLEAAIENGQIGDQTLYFESVRQMVDSVMAMAGGNNLAVKFHPAQSFQVKEGVMKIITDMGFTPAVIPSEIPFEQLLLNSKNLRVAGFTTSLLYYAKLLGHRVISYEDLILRDDCFKRFRTYNDFDLKGLLNS
ncbi:MAG: polysialyltransferase family glycosyltransferase [Cyclobacteriaceae bacterium]